MEVFPVGAEVSGKVAEWALADGYAEETKVVAPTETKRKRGRPRKVREPETES